MNQGFKWGFWLCFVGLFCMGFRVYEPTQPWDALSRQSSATTKLFVIYEQASMALTNNLPSDDGLYGSSTITVAQAMDSIFADYNSVQAAYVSLVDNTDPDYNATAAARRTIYVRNKAADGANLGQAQFSVDEDGVYKCEVALTDSVYDDAKTYIGVVTHELGHCLGLDHPQEVTRSVMSYFSEEGVIRLQVDDKMAVTYLYPVSPKASQEDPTFGLSCAARE